MNVFNYFQSKLNAELEALSESGALPTGLDARRAGVRDGEVRTMIRRETLDDVVARDVPL